MTPQESQLLKDFLGQLEGVRGVPKDAEAEALIKQAAGRQPDALYLLVQRSIMQDQAVEAASARITALEREVAELKAAGSAAKPAAAAGSSFLDPNAWGRRPAAPTQAMSAAPAAAMRPGMVGRSGGSFLGTAAATMAGVVGGAFLFQGLQHLMHQSGQPDALNAHSAAAASDVASPGGFDEGSFDTASAQSSNYADPADAYDSSDSFGGGDDSIV